MAPKSDFDVKKLNSSDNYHYWKFSMENYLALKKLDKCVQPKPNLPAVSVESSPEKLIEAKSILSLSVDDSIIVHIRKAKSALEIWNILENLYEDKGLLRKTGLLRALMSVRLDEVKSMKTYVEDIMNISNKLSGIGFEIGNDWLASILLAGLSEEYKPFIMSIEGSGVQVTADMIKQKLLDSEVGENNTHGEVLFTNKKSKFNPRRKGFTCYNCGGKNHKSIHCMQDKDDASSSDAESVSSRSSRSTKDDGKNGKNNSGHVKSAFLKSVTNNPRPENGSRKVAFSAEFMSNDGIDDINEWYIDSCSSGHMTPSVELLNNRKRCNVKPIVASNGSNMRVECAGNVKMKISKNDIHIQNVMHTPEVRANLLSVSEIVSKGNAVLFTKDGCSIYDQFNKLIVHCKSENGVYKIRSNQQKPVAKHGYINGGTYESTSNGTQINKNRVENFVSVRDAKINNKSCTPVKNKNNVSNKEVDI